MRRWWPSAKNRPARCKSLGFPVIVCLIRLWAVRKNFVKRSLHCLGSRGYFKAGVTLGLETTKTQSILLRWLPFCTWQLGSEGQRSADFTALLPLYTWQLLQKRTEACCARPAVSVNFKVTIHVGQSGKKNGKNRNDGNNRKFAEIEIYSNGSGRSD